MVLQIFFILKKNITDKHKIEIMALLKIRYHGDLQNWKKLYLNFMIPYRQNEITYYFL